MRSLQERHTNGTGHVEPLYQISGRPGPGIHCILELEGLITSITHHFSMEEDQP